MDENEKAVDESGQKPLQYPKLKQTKDWFGAPDYYLQRMADMGNATGWGMGLTLLVNGMVVQGTVTSGQNYFETSAARVRAGVAADEVDEETARVAERMIGYYLDDPAAEIDVQKYGAMETDEGMTRYIHLSDVSIIQSGQQTLNLDSFRVLLSHVSAWAVGRR
ncbi:hypothetical protein [Tsukamurella sp. USMM236]|uniref:hypothetical protein n=1 Tax=Tsukamurella sp. USMM236 TaxID=3081301 RepID=UPI00301AFC09